MNKLVVYLVLASPIIAVLATIGYLGYLTSDKKNFETEGGTEAEIVKRTSNRGTLVSLVSAILLNIIGAIMASNNVPEGMILINYGFILGPVIGYLLDIGIGTDEGFGLFKKNPVDWFLYMMSNLMDSKFARYIISVLLDLFISDPIMSVMKNVATPLTKNISNREGKYSNFVGQNFPSILQSIVGFITFNAYTNQTRFNWAYASENLPKEKRINPFTISLVVALAASVYTIVNKDSEDRGMKLMYSIVAIGILYALNNFNKMEAPLATGDEEKKELEVNMVNGIIGLVIFIGFLMYGLVLPFLNAKK